MNDHFESRFPCLNVEHDEPNCLHLAASERCKNCKLRSGGAIDVVDCDEKEPIRTGTRVVCIDDQPAGTVTLITDPDGDVNDYGLPVAINPRVFVAWDGEEQREDPSWSEGFTTHWMGRWHDDDAPFVCDDLKVVTT